MAGNFNKVILMGRLTRDVEMRSLPSGMSVANFGLAVNERYKDRDGNWVERANFIDCEMFGNRAEAFAKYLGKGSAAFIEGRLKLDQWEDKDGNKRSKLKVIAESFEFIDSKGSGGGGGGGGDYARSGASQGGTSQQASGGNAGGGGGGGGYNDSGSMPPDDDIPF